jgi:hypothetical protein
VVGGTVGYLIGDYRHVGRGSLPALGECGDIQLTLENSAGERYKVDAEAIDYNESGVRARLSDGSKLTRSWEEVRGASCREGSYVLEGAAIGFGADIAFSLLVFLALRQVNSLD